jgi:hypothetical protein
MGTKIAAFIITALINFVVGVVGVFAILLAMNGFSESDGTWGLAAYLLLALSVTVAMGGLAVLITQKLLKREFRAAVAVLIAVTVGSILGAGLKFICIIIGLLVANYVRVNW